MNLLYGFLIVAGATAIAVTAMLLVRRRAPEGSYFSDGDRAPGVFGVLATGFSVLLGFIIFLAFSSYDQACWMARLAAHHPNLWFDTAAMATNASLLARFVAEAGVDRLLLGTNCYGAAQADYYPAAIDIVRVSTELSDADKDAILGGNARRLFDLEDAPS